MSKSSQKWTGQEWADWKKSNADKWSAQEWRNRGGVYPNGEIVKDLVGLSLSLFKSGSSCEEAEDSTDGYNDTPAASASHDASTAVPAAVADIPTNAVVATFDGDFFLKQNKFADHHKQQNAALKYLREF